MILILSQFGYESLFYLRLALLESIFCSYAGFVGGVAEWLNAPVLKTDVGESLPWVRIPPPPPLNPIIHWVMARLPNREPFLFSGYKDARDDRVTIFLSSKCSALVLTKRLA